MQKYSKATDIQLCQFFTRYGPCARDAYFFATNPQSYESFVKDQVRLFAWDTIERSLHNAAALSLREGSDRVFLLQPEPENRREYFMSIASPVVMEIFSHYPKAKWRDYVKKFYKLYLREPKTRANAGWILKIQLLIKMETGGEISMRRMEAQLGGVRNRRFKIKYDEEVTTFTYPSNPPTYYPESPPLHVTETGYYIPQSRTNPTFDSFLYSSEDKTATFIQATVADEHHINTAGLEEMEKIIPQGTIIRYLAVVDHGWKFTCSIPESWRKPLELFALRLTRREVSKIRRVLTTEWCY